MLFFSMTTCSVGFFSPVVLSGRSKGMCIHIYGEDEGRVRHRLIGRALHGRTWLGHIT